MNIENLSNFELNKKVALLRNKDVTSIGKQVSISDSAVYFELPNGSYGEASYAEIPSDAWPIIIENEISLVPHGDGVWIAAHGNDISSAIYCADKNPLRAVVIVYLKMKG